LKQLGAGGPTSTNAGKIRKKEEKLVERGTTAKNSAKGPYGLGK